MSRADRSQGEVSHGSTGPMAAVTCFHEIFAAQVARAPEAAALIFEGRTVSYRQLEERSNRLAHYLRSQGCGPEVVVALVAERGIDLITAILAVVKSGAAYLALDPQYPEARLKATVEDAGARLVLAQEGVRTGLGSLGERCQELEGCLEASQALPPTPTAVAVDPDNLAYVIYTSGSTGRPKGVLVPHRGLVHLARAQVSAFGLEPGKRVLQFAPPSFDVSVSEMLSCFHSGATLVLADREELLPGLGLLGLLRREGVTHLLLPPSVLAALPVSRLPALETIVCGAEALPASLVTAWGQRYRIINAYGPTEVTVCSTLTECPPDGATPSIGKPLPATRAYVTTPSLTLLPEGEREGRGELVLGGPGVTRGYLDRPALTAERFVPDPFSGEAGARLYRSGDAVSWRPDGSLDFGGRLDHQVKIHGYRIEPGEVQAVLNALPQVGQSYVMARTEASGGHRLVAYATPASLDEEAVLASLRESLPAYMVPSALVALEELPLGATGKVDREALPAPQKQRLAADAETPRDPLERGLVEICEELLGVSGLGRDADFFALGGHSLLVGRLVARIRGAFGAELTLQEVYGAPTVAGLAELLRRGGGRKPLPPIRRVSRDEPAPLSFPQERVWFLSELAPGNIAYNTQTTITFEGPLRPAVLQRALNEIVRRHEVLRTRFPAVGGEPRQEVRPAPPIPLPVVDLTGLSGPQREREEERLVHRAVSDPFDLLEVPLARWTVLRTGPQTHVLVQVEHHFVHDGWAFALLLQEIQDLYTAFAADEPSPLEEPPVHSSDFAIWQREWLQGEVLEEYLDYWTRQLEGSPQALELPTDFPRPKVQSFAGDAIRVELPEPFCEDLRELARQLDVTLFTVMLTGFEALLLRYTGQTDLLVGTAAANRRLREVEQMLGMVVNTLVLRCQTGWEQPFAELAGQLKDTALGAYSYQDMPLDKLVQRLMPERDMSRNPLFQVMFSFHDSPVPDLEFAGLTGRIFECHNGSAKSDLNVVGIPRAEQRVGREAKAGERGIILMWEFCTALYERRTMERMVEQYRNLLAGAVASPGASLGELPLLGAAERGQLLGYNDTARAYPQDRCLHQLFEAVAARQPDALAVADGERFYTYGELARGAEGLAGHLRRLGVGAESLVALSLPASSRLVLAALAVTKAGGAYLPLDPEHPAQRLRYIARDSGVEIVITDSELPTGLDDLGLTVVALDALPESAAEPVPDLETAAAVGPGNRAYVIYTSGSTGKPKGSEIPHRGAVNLASWHNAAFEVGPGDRATLVASPAFDASVWEIWPYLAAGASLHVPPAELKAAPRQLYDWLAATAITICFLPTPLGEAVLEEEPPPELALRTLLVGGDKLRQPPPPGLPFTVVNNYGLTEDSVVATSAPVPPGTHGDGERPVAPTIGKVIDNKQGWILDPLLGLAPVGVPGELFIGGDGLARSYLDRPGLTAERFLPNPLAAEGEEGSRLYRTGDRARWLSQAAPRPGELEFLGRGDRQVQVRGFRVEPGEVEAALLEHPKVHAAAVLPSATGGRLVGFVVGKDGDRDPGQSLEEHLLAWLEPSFPEYMVPARLKVLEELPLAPGGKVDRMALAARVEQVLRGDTTTAEKTMPRTPTEEIIAGLWAAQLGRERVGVEEDFFVLGGHSLLATRVVARLRDVFEVDLPLRSLFEWPTVRRLAREVDRQLRVEGDLGAVTPVPREGELPMSSGQERLWFLDRLIARPSAYHITRAYELCGDLRPEVLELSLSHLVARHEALRTSFAEAAGTPVQRVAPAGAPETLPALPLIDLSGLGEVAAETAAALRRQEGKRPFVLGRLPLARWTLLRFAPRHHHLLVTFHHIITDGWSMGLLFRELSETYRALLDGEAPAASPPGLQYPDFAVWQRQSLEGEALASLLDYWRDKLEGTPKVLELPLDRPRPNLQSFRGGQVQRRLPGAAAGRLRSLAADAGVTWFMALLAAFGALLGRLADQPEVVIGTPVAGRGRRELESVVGFFVNTLALRLGLAGKPTFRALLERARETTLGGLSHQALPFERLVAELAPDRDLSHAPVFQVLLVPVDPAMEALELSGLEAEVLPVHREEAQFDLALFVQETEAGLAMTLRYDAAIFDATTAERTLRHLENFLTEALEHPRRKVHRLALLSAAERHAALVAWNDTGREFPRRQLLHEPFEARAAQAPEATAVTTSKGSLSYGELNRRANRLAHRLREQGAGPGVLVAVHLGRSEAMLVAVLAALKAGAAYVPLETNWPAERCRWILERRGIALLITGRAHLEILEAQGPLTGVRHTICLDPSGRGPEAIRRQPETDPPPSADASDLAYIIFTSGSTGHPKGVMVRHRPVANLIQWVNEGFGVSSDDCLLYTTALSFDLSVYDIFGTLAAGGIVRLASEAELEDPQRLVDLLAGGEVTFWDSAPTALQRLVPLFSKEAPSSRLRLVFLSGDWIPVGLPDQVRSTFPEARVIALGGATEATVWSNFFPVGKVDPSWVSIPYGRPIDNGRYLILDDELEPCPIGVVGDLYIAGEVLSTGYAGEARQTAESYLPDPHAQGSPLGATPGGRLYRTGDRARRWPDGTMEFMGRRDFQVKLRGYRIELGEIETVLSDHPSVETAVAVVREDTPGDQRLVAYYSTPSGTAVEAEELRRRAAARLPEYMVPSAFLELTTWPVTATGKLDRGALPSPREARAPGLAPAVSARSYAEEVIAGIWRQVIQVDEVGRDDNFFDLGGHSLLLAKVHTRLKEELDAEVEMADLFRHPTVSALARALASEVEVPEAAAQPEVKVSAAAEAVADTGQIAIVGMAGRFAASRDLEEFWQALRQGRELTRELSDEELLGAGVPEEHLSREGYVRRRGVLEDWDRFDAELFGYSPREAEVIDPQQRLFLETAWQALEDAGYGPRRSAAAGSPEELRVGVFAGASASDYQRGLLADSSLVRAVGGYQIALSNQPDYLPTRASYKLDLQGPSLNVQTACSTSLVAVHLAAKSLRDGECSLALAGGVRALPQERKGYFHEAGGIASPDGRTRAFDAAAAGTVGGSGVGVVVLKRLEDALADGDTVRAVIRGSGLTNDGSHKMGFTAPSAAGQAAAIRQAQKAAGVEPATIDYVEAHGTGTALGDPIEVDALNEVFASGEEGRRCALGSVKTNIGHLDAAAGIGGLIKTVLALEHEELPPSLHFDTPNPEIDFAAGPFRVQTALAPWPRRAGVAGAVPRRAGVSSFGIGGTNAHVVLEEAPAEAAKAPRAASPLSAQLLALSAHTPSALAAMADRLAAHLKGSAPVSAENLADIAYTLQVGRGRFRHRLSVVCRSAEEAVAALSGEAPAAVDTRDEQDAEGRTVFLFPGQGSQYAGMAAELLRELPVFRRELERCAEVLKREAEIDLLGILALPEGEGTEAADERLRRTALTQPALFAVEYALARQWMAWGVTPAALLGHSIGEYVAACLAGVFELEDALRLVALRGRRMEEMEGGSMLSVALGEEELAGHLEDLDDLELAAVNGPRSSVVSGPPAALEKLREGLTAAGVESQALHTSHAFHSRAMEPMLEGFEAAVAEVPARAPEIPFLSNVTGTWITAAEATDPSYWARQLRATVRFGEGLERVLEEPGGRLLEVGPGRQLATLARRHPLGERASLIATSLPHPSRRGQDLTPLLRALGQLWLAGTEPDWTALHGEGRRRRPLPTYPFEGQSYLAGVEPDAAGGRRRIPGDRRERPERVEPSASPAALGRDELSPVEGGVAEIWGDMLGVRDLRPHDDFFDLGGSSLMAIRLGQRLHQAFGVELPSTFLLEGSTLEAVAEAVKGASSGEGPVASSCLVRLQPGTGDLTPLFLVHQVGGQAFTFQALARSLGDDQPVYALRSLGLEAGEEPLDTVEEMAGHYLELVRGVQPDGPYRLGGASMGGMVAFEMARQLRAGGEDVELLTVMDTPCLEQMPEREDEAASVAAVYRGHAGIDLDLEALRRLEGLDERLRYAAERSAEAGGDSAAFSAEAARRLVTVMEANVAALYAYRPEPLKQRILLFRAAQRRPGDPPRPELAWIQLALGGLDFVETPGNHLSMHEPPQVGAMAEYLRSRLLESAPPSAPSR